MPTHNLPEHERANPTRRPAASEAPAADAGAAPHPLLALQRQIGNAQVSRMLAQREAAPDEEEEELQAKHDPALAQREAAPEEEELQAKHDPALAQREGAPGEEEEELQAKHDLTQRAEEEAVGAELASPEASPEVGLEGGPVSDGLASRIQAQRGGGAPLAEGTRATMEQHLGAGFEDVRVHTDGESDALNRSISAKAFTTGSDIFFRKDASPSDEGLLAHELTHVVQQRSMTGGGGGMHVGPAGDSYEQQADATAAAVTSGVAPAAQREHDDA